MTRYGKNLLIGCIDIPFNTMAAGSPYETFSERSWRWKTAGKNRFYLRLGAMLVALIDGIFGRGHCKNATEGDEAQYDLLDPSPVPQEETKNGRSNP